MPETMQKESVQSDLPELTKRAILSIIRHILDIFSVQGYPFYLISFETF